MRSKLNYRPSASVEELLSMDDDAFVHSVYWTILGRSPDKEGYSYYLFRLQRGVSRAEVISQVRKSNEAELFNRKQEWIETIYKRYQKTRVPIYGLALRIFGYKAIVPDIKKIARDVYSMSAEGFTDYAYQAVLGRSPDKEGRDYYLSRLHNGVSEAQVIYQLRTSQEGKLFARKQEWVELVCKRYRLSRIPILGWILRLFGYQVLARDVDSMAQVAYESLSEKTIIQSAVVPDANSETIKASVVVLTKNPGEIFKRVLPAIRAQITPWEFEIMVVDSGSTDGTIEFVQQYADVRLIQIESSEFGHGKTRNFAVSQSRGEFAAMLTHDAMPADEYWLDNLIKPFMQDSKVAGVFGRHKAYPEHSSYTQRDMQVHFDGFLQWPAIMGMEDPERYKRDQGYQQLLHFFSDNNACLRKSVWKKIPYPDVNFAEDQLWAKAIIESGYKRAYANDAAVFHSHDYSVKDTFRRSFDESRALKTLFGYDLCPSAGHGVKQVYACIKSDFSYLSSNGGIFKNFFLALKTPFLHVAKQLGFFIGRYEGKYKSTFFWLFSLDDAKKRKKGGQVSKNQLSDQGAWKSDVIAEKTEIAKYSPQNKIDVIGFYDFILTKDAGVMSEGAADVGKKTINWLIPDFGIGSGGHLNIFRYINMLEKKGFTNTICLVGDHRYSSADEAREVIREHFFKLDATVVIGIENLAPANCSFATSWITAYTLRGFSKTRHKFYFVQDFEPAFYARGSEYNFAEETYKFGFIGICSGSWLSETLNKDYGMQCHTIGFSYDYDLYQQTHRREPEKLRVFCYIRPPTIRRGLESSLLALSLVGERMPEVEFIFAGWDMGAYYFPYEHLNAGLCTLAELPDLYSQCDAALVFSYTNLSLLPLELMACGSIVVSNKAPNTTWLLNSDNSVIPESASPRAIADAIIDILENPEKRKKLAAKAKMFAKSTSWESEGERLSKILESILK
jgi:O-antigen biosynthesis protein